MKDLLLYSNIGLWVVQIFIIFSLFLIFRQFGKVYLNTGEGISRDGIPIGQAVPKFHGFSPNIGETLDINAVYRSEKPTLISFVSLNCPACNDMIPHWNNAIKKYQKNTNFLMIIVGKNRGEIESMLSKHKILGNVIVDHDNEILTDFGVRVTPFAFATDKMGIVKDKGLCNNLLHIEHFISGVTNDNEISKQKILEKGVKVHA